MSEVNPWIVQEPKQMAQVPNGAYVGPFKGIEVVKLQDGSLKWRFAWEVKSGPEAGKLATALTDQSINSASLPGRLIAGLLGRDLVAGEDVKAAIEACVGQSSLVVVQPGPKGGKPGVKSVNKPVVM